MDWIQNRVIILCGLQQYQMNVVNVHLQGRELLNSSCKETLTIVIVSQARAREREREREREGESEVDIAAAAAAADMAGLSGGTDLPVGLGQGSDTVLGEGRNTVVTTEFESFGATSSVRYQICKGIDELLEAFEIDQSLTVGLLNASSVSQKLRFVQSQKVTSTSVSIAIYANNIEHTETVTHASLNDGIQPPHSSQELREFFMAYGDSYLSSRTHGGEYCALYLYNTQTREQQSELSTQLNAAGIFTKGSVDASLGSTIESFNSTTRVHVSFTQTISGICNPQLPDPNNMIEFALTFPSLPLTAAVITHFATTGYEHLPQIGSAFIPIAQNRDLIAHDHLFTHRLGQLEELQNTIASIKSIYRFYGGYRDATLEQVEAQADLDKRAVVEMVRSYVADPITGVVQPVLTSIDRGSPQLQFIHGQSPAFGGGGGGAFDGVPDLREYLSKQTRITALQLSTGLVVDRLTVTYSDVQSLNHGGSGGGTHNRTVLDVGSFVTSISGFYGKVRGVSWDNPVLTRLTIKLSDGREVPGAGRNGTTPFLWTVPGDSFVVGFRGRSGWYLDQLQVVYASFRPALWIR